MNGNDPVALLRSDRTLVAVVAALWAWIALLSVVRVSRNLFLLVSVALLSALTVVVYVRNFGS